MTGDLGTIFAALADPIRRQMVEVMVREGSTSVPALSSSLPISRQAVAKHLAALDGAGLVERLPGPGRQVRYRPRQGALREASAWLYQTETAWDDRLTRLKDAVEGGSAQANGAG